MHQMKLAVVCVSLVAVAVVASALPLARPVFLSAVLADLQ
jgi:hypothetical protein